jgi:para-nitrobenzyl esterase
MFRFLHGRTPPTHEDCLTLNVWTPGRPTGESWPVFVWLYGGGWAMGFASQGELDGATLAANEKMIVVTLNYRLGSLGWLYHPALNELGGGEFGNRGLLDQVAALRWVRDNAAALGGDPARVTIAGQSAGALSVVHLLASPLSEGLFRGAIVQSAPLGEPMSSPDQGSRWAEDLNRVATGRDGFDLVGLRQVGAGELVESHEKLLGAPPWKGTPGGARPTLDSATIPLTPEDTADVRTGIDVIVGTTAEETTYLYRPGARGRAETESELISRVTGLPGIGDPHETVAAHRAQAIRDGASSDPQSLLIRISTDLRYTEPARRWARRRASAGGRVYLYRVDHRGPDPDFGAGHTVDVPLVFGTYATDPVARRLTGGGPASAAASTVISRAWGSFVRGEAPGWPPVGARDEATMAVFGADNAVSDPHPHETFAVTQ